MTTDYGIDFLCLTDLSADLRLVSGVDLLRQAAYHRITNRVLVDDDNFGLDITEEVGRAADASYLPTIALKVSAAIQKDERIATAETSASGVTNPRTGDLDVTLRINCTATTGETFVLVVSVQDGTVSILNGEA